MYKIIKLTLSRAVGLEKECNGVIFSKRSEFRKDFLTLEEVNDQHRKNEKAESMIFRDILSFQF